MDRPFIMTLIELGIGLGTLIGAGIALKYILKYLHERLRAHPGKWTEKLHDIIHTPARVILWVIGITFFLDVLCRYLKIDLGGHYLASLRSAVIVGCVGWMAFRWKMAVQRSVLAQGKWGHKVMEPGIVAIVGRLGSMIIVILTALIILQILGVDVAPLMAFGGIGAAAIGFAGRDVIANFFGGFMLHITRPFTPGDYILFSDKVEGTVEEIGWYLTSLRDKHKRPVYLPNALFSTALVVNASRMSHRRIEEKLSVRYRDFSKVSELVAKIRQQIQNHPRIDTHLPVLVFFNHFAEYALEIYVEAYTLATQMEEYLAVKQDILMQVQKHFEAAGAEMPFPTRTIELRNERPS